MSSSSFVTCVFHNRIPNIWHLTQKGGWKKGKKKCSDRAHTGKKNLKMTKGWKMLAFLIIWVSTGAALGWKVILGWYKFPESSSYTPEASFQKSLVEAIKGSIGFIKRDDAKVWWTDKNVEEVGKLLSSLPLQEWKTSAPSVRTLFYRTCTLLSPLLWCT